MAPIRMHVDLGWVPQPNVHTNMKHWVFIWGGVQKQTPILIYHDCKTSQRAPDFGKPVDEATIMFSVVAVTQASELTMSAREALAVFGEYVPGPPLVRS